MVKNSDLQRVQHIEEYCAEISETIERFGGFDVFITDKDYYKSVTSTLFQIGELSIGLTDEFKESSKDRIPWKEVRGMRNMYAHGYKRLDKETIWSISTKNVPELQLFCKNVIEQSVVRDMVSVDEDEDEEDMEI